MTKSLSFAIVFSFLIIFFCGIIAYIADLDWLGKYAGMLLFIDEIIFVILLVTYGSPKKEPSSEVTKSKILKFLKQLFIFLFMGGGLTALLVTNVDFNKLLFSNIGLFDIIKLFYFGSQVLAFMHYFFTIVLQADNQN